MRLIDADAFEREVMMMTDEALCEDCCYNVLAKLDDASTVGGWVSVKDRLPESGKHVLITCEIRSLYGYKKQYVCEAFYAAEHSISEGKYPDDTDCYDYSEEDDEYYLKEGWYEVIHNWDDYSSVVIYDFVTHWMALPEPAQEATDERTD